MSASPWKLRARRLLTWALLLQAAGVLAFALLLFVGERTHLGFLALYAPRQPLLAATLLFLVLAVLGRRRLLVVLQVALTALVLFPIMGLSLAGARASEHRPVQLATYNVYFGKLGRPELLAELEALPADVLLLQAAYDSLGERLRERFPDRTVRQDGELVLITRFGVRDVEVPDALPGDLRPMFVTYVLDTADGPLTVTNVHPFSPRHALFGEADAARDVAQRAAQIEAAVASARRRGPPFVVAGDTNLPAPSTLARRAFDGLEDGFATAGLGFGYTFPAKRPWMRIDRVLAGPNVRFVETRVAPTRGRPTSDHRPVLATFEIVRAR